MVRKSSVQICATARTTLGDGEKRNRRSRGNRRIRGLEASDFSSDSSRSSVSSASSKKPKNPFTSASLCQYHHVPFRWIFYAYRQPTHQKAAQHQAQEEQVSCAPVHVECPQDAQCPPPKGDAVQARRVH